jgi:hypothetical protein
MPDVRSVTPHATSNNVAAPVRPRAAQRDFRLFVKSPLN